jgi:hypothetical protein
LEKFKSDCKKVGLEVEEVKNEEENWIEPFMTNKPRHKTKALGIVSTKEKIA